jgi:hypothetical protein
MSTTLDDGGMVIEIHFVARPFAPRTMASIALSTWPRPSCPLPVFGRQALQRGKI